MTPIEMKMTSRFSHTARLATHPLQRYNSQQQTLGKRATQASLQVAERRTHYALSVRICVKKKPAITNTSGQTM